MSSSSSSDSPESSAAIAVGDREEVRSRSGSSGGNDSDAASSSSDNNLERDSNRANDDNGEDGVMVSKDSVGGGSSDEVVVSEESAREDMFLDASEDLGADGRESTAAYTEPRDNSDNEQQIQFRGFETGMQNDYMVDEMERLRAVLDKTINEKDSIAREYKDEIEMAEKAIANLRDQMRDLIIVKSILPGDETSGLGDRFVAPELGDSGQQDNHLHGMIHECQMLIRDAVESRRQAEEAIRQLQDNVHVKDQAIGHLDGEVAELTISRHVVDSYLSSANSLSMELQLQKDQYIDDAANRMLSSLASVVYVEQLSDNSLPGKIAHLEKAMFALLENYNWFLIETDQLRLRLVEVRPDLVEQNDYALAFSATRDELLDLKRKEVDFVEKMRNLEDGYNKLEEQLNNQKNNAEAVDADLQKARAELEQERNRYLNTKEKLSLAVSKGKQLVQQRDVLKKSLADKSSELERCLSELQDRSTALESAELIKEELVKSQISVASLQDMLSQKDIIFEKLEEAISESGAPEELRSTEISDRVKWLVDERNNLMDVSIKFHALVDSLSSMYPQENIPADLESRLVWLGDSFDLANTEISTLRGEISRTKEAAQDEIGTLTSSLSAALVEKDYFKLELDAIKLKYDEAVEKVHEVSSGKEQVSKTLLEVSGITMDNDEEYKHSSDAALLVQQCLEKTRERSLSLDSPQVSVEAFESMQTFLYVRDQELVLCEQLLEEETPEKLELSRALSHLRKASDELAVLKEERENLKKDLERSEEKSSLIREKLSMAVKKGKGLVQERENLKQLIDGKSAEIEELRIQLEQKESTISDCRDQITRLSSDVDCIPKLEGDLAAMSDLRGQIERDLQESNKLLQSLMQLIDDIVMPLRTDFEDPIEKVKWLGNYLNSCLAEKLAVEQEIGTVKMDAENSASKLEEVSSTIKSLEDALSVAETSISQLVEERSNLEGAKTRLEDQLHGAAEESLQKASLLEETTAAKSSLESALSQAETTIDMLRKEMEESESSRAAAEAELADLKEEFSILTSRLAESSSSIKSLEDAATQLEGKVALITEEKIAAETAKSNAVNELHELKEAVAAKTSLESVLSQAETDIAVLRREKEESETSRAAAKEEIANLKEEVSVLTARLAESSSSIKLLEAAAAELEIKASLLTEEKNAAETGKTDAVNELQKLKEEAGLWDHKLQDALVRIKSLEDALEEAKSNLSVLADEKDAAENETVALSAKLNACMEELSGSHGSLESQSVELFGHLKALQLLINDNPIFSFLEKYSRKRLETLKEMGLLCRSIRDHVDAIRVENLPVAEETTYKTEIISDDGEKISCIQFDRDNVDAAETGDISSYVQNIAENYQARHRDLLEKFDVFSNLEDGFSSAVLEELRETMSKITLIPSLANSLKLEIGNMETDKTALEREIGALKNDVTILESACNDATKELEADFDMHTLEFNTSSKHVADIQQDTEKNRHTMAAEKLLSATKEAHNTLVHLQNSESGFASTIQKMQDELTKSKAVAEEAILELNLNESKMSKIETDFKVLQNSYDDLIRKLEEAQASEVELSNKEAEISSLRNSLLMKEQEAGAALLWVSQVKNILDKTNKIDITSAKKDSSSFELQDSVYMNRLRNIMDDFADLQHQNEVLSNEKEEFQSATVSQLCEIENLKKLCEKDGMNEQELERVKNEFDNLVRGVETVIQKLGGRDFTGDNKLVATSELVEVMEKLVMRLVMESDNSKARAQELNAKLFASQNAVDELLSKVKLLEDSVQDRASTSEVIQERSVFEAPSPPPASEISEIEEVGTVSKPSISPVPSAAHVRNMRKGASNDYIALDVASERLISNEAADDEKGHTFKSLNASGLIPVQGKLVADRVDGLWVSAGRVLMSRPRARLGLVAYWLLLHIWLLGTIL